MSRMRKVLAVLGIGVLLALAAARAPGAGAPEFTGVKGRVALKGQPVAGVVVYAYKEFDDGLASVPLGRSEPSNAGGEYAFPLPPGTYYLVAARMDGPLLAELRDGDLFCYFGANPVKVEPRRTTRVGFNLVWVRKDVEPEGKTGVSGVVYDENGDRLTGGAVYFYKSPADGFRGIPGFFARIGEDGSFRARIRKGRFFVVARKRATGDLFGPAEIGDYFGFYTRNPVTVEDGEARGLRIDAVRRVGGLEAFDGLPAAEQPMTLRITIVDAAKKPLPGVRVLVYREAAMTGLPAFVSRKSGADGGIELPVAEAGAYYLLARERLGGPADGEWYGKYAAPADNAVRLTPGEATAPIEIVVERR